MSVKLIYLPGIDGALGAGEMMLGELPEHESFQFSYERAATQSFDALVEAVLQAADEHGFERFVVVGESFGGALAQTLTQRHPERVQGVILVASFMRHPAPLLGRFIGYMLRKVPRAFLRMPIRVVGTLTMTRDLSPEKRADFYESLFAMPFEPIGERLRTLEGFDVSEGSAWKQPTLWIWGEKDRLINFKAHRRWLHDCRRDDRWHVIPGAGHLIPRAALEVATGDIRDYLHALQA